MANPLVDTSPFVDLPTATAGAPHAHVVVFPGRGETASGYKRLADRLAIDSLRVVVYQGPRVDALPENDEDIRHLSEQALLKIGDTQGKPVITIGSDAGGLVALHVARTLGDKITAVAVAGLPVNTSLPVGPEFEAELDLRSACTSYRGLLNGDAMFRRGAVLTRKIPSFLWDRLAPREITVPVLVLQGEDDKLSDVAPVKDLVRKLPRARLSIVRHGRHDVINDHDHRAIGSEIAIFIQRARRGADLPAIVRNDLDTFDRATPVVSAGAA
jgi:alpha-beta hydrolase superfamily lysophospholipase